MKIVLAPDSFKGSLSAPAVCSALELGVSRVFPGAQIERAPLADGGEGTLEALLAGTDGKERNVWVRGPQGEDVSAKWGFTNSGLAVIEMAQAAGLTLNDSSTNASSTNDALGASTWGVGQLIRAALEAGCREFLIGLGGSATTDGATGALSALGARFFDENHVVLAPGGGALGKLAFVDTRFLDARLAKSKFTVLCDVSNPLHGQNGAAHVYAPQKGATPAQVEILDAGLKQLADVCAQTFVRDLRDVPGSGAAGGTAFGLMTFLGAEMRSGIEAVMEATGLDSKLRDADLVLTGEGALDEQTLRGKVVAGVCRAAREHRVPVIALGGRVALSGAQMDELGLLSAFSLADGPRDLESCLQNAPALLADIAERALRVWKAAAFVDES